MAAIAVIRIGSVKTKGLFRAEFDGENWTYEELPKPEGLQDTIWQLNKIEARAEFKITQADVYLKLLGEDPPYNMDLLPWAAKLVMDQHVERGLGLIVQPISKDDLLILT